MPALGPMLAAAETALADHAEGLFSGDTAEGQRMLRDRLAQVERRFADFPTSHEVKAVIERRGCEAIEDGGITSPNRFRDEGLETLGRWIVDRLHFKPTEMD